MDITSVGLVQPHVDGIFFPTFLVVVEVVPTEGRLYRDADVGTGETHRPHSILIKTYAHFGFRTLGAVLHVVCSGCGFRDRLDHARRFPKAVHLHAFHCDLDRCVRAAGDVRLRYRHLQARYGTELIAQDKAELLRRIRTLRLRHQLHVDLRKVRVGRSRSAAHLSALRAHVGERVDHFGVFQDDTFGLLCKLIGYGDGRSRSSFQLHQELTAIALRNEGRSNEARWQQRNGPDDEDQHGDDHIALAAQRLLQQTAIPLLQVGNAAFERQTEAPPQCILRQVFQLAPA